MIQKAPCARALLNGRILVTTKTGADPGPFRKLFASVRFGGQSSPLVKAEALKRALSKHHMELVIVNTPGGNRVTDTVFPSLESCDGFVAFATSKYGEQTTHEACTFYEVERWNQLMPLRPRPIVIDMRADG